MDAETLYDAMGARLTRERYAELLPAFNAAMVAADCTTERRAAMWCAQLGHESAGLRYMEEIASGADYENRRDLGNVRPGDGRKFKGHGPIQITGRHNHLAVSEWAFARGIVSSPTYFVDNPKALASDKFGFVGAVWYWRAARPKINAMCDADDLTGVTRAINGGTHGLDDRRKRYRHALTLGRRLLPTGPAPSSRTRRTSEDAVSTFSLPATPAPPPGAAVDKWPRSGEVRIALAPAVADGWRGTGSLSSLFAGWYGRPSGYLEYLRVISHPGGRYDAEPRIDNLLEAAQLVGNWTIRPIKLPEFCTGLLVKYAAPAGMVGAVEYEH